MTGDDKEWPWRPGACIILMMQLARRFGFALAIAVAGAAIAGGIAWKVIAPGDVVAMTPDCPRLDANGRCVGSVTNKRGGHDRITLVAAVTGVLCFVFAFGLVRASKVPHAQRVKT